MGEVYRAVDTTLGRDVAIKLLPPDVAVAPERVTRLRREAQLLAALNHPNIAAIYGLHEAGGNVFLVLELANGEDLAQLLRRGPLSLDMAISVGSQIAHALEEAHEKGIVHRDLKPANIKLSRDGKVKVLDFGLAKAYGGEFDPPKGDALSRASTMTGERAESGAILGTAAYMSPEQARGLPVDKRTDIWAFGVVLFEMITGHRLFPGVTLADTLASVLTAEIPWDRLPQELTPAQRQLLRRCLDRDRGQRLRDIGEARIALDALTNGEGPAASPPALSGKARSAAWVALALLPLAGALGLLSLRPTEETLRPFRFKAAIGADASLARRSGLALSSDGSTLAFILESPGRPAQLYVRKLDQLAGTALAGTQDASDPFFSPDGEWIGFFADRKLKKVPSAGGAVTTLCDAPGARGGAWTASDVIVFGASGRGAPLQKVSAQGGSPASLGSLAADEVAQAWPQALPGNTILYSSHRAGTGTFESADVMATSLDGAAPVLVTRGAFFGRYMAGGHVLFVRNGRVMAAPFDLGSLTIRGEPVPIAEDVANDATTGTAQYALSPTGTLVYAQRRPPAAAERPVFWMDDAGRTAPLRPTRSDWTTLRFAPGGKMLAMAIREGAQYDLWSYEWNRDAMTKVTFDPGNELNPVWTPDGGGIVFAASREPGVSNLYFQRLDRTGSPQRLTESANPQIPCSFHPSARFLAYTERNPNSKEDILILRIEDGGAPGLKASKPMVFLNTNASETRPMFSPDGRWVAYNSNESGRHEVYVRAFPGPGGPWKISTEGGASPQWSKTRPEIFYAESGPVETRIMVSPFVVEGSQFRPGPPARWSPRGFALDEDFELHPDGQRVATGPTERSSASTTDQIVIFLNILTDLKRLAPPSRSP